ncbi:helix-turn-helix domain-containing protein [Limosilactobacillus antri]|uniref:helix-turn-helix domain-containing protein n=1 Tax=Limosilactobacillus antri TaxID=227943 RepID=UPI001F5AC617|nr:helix-turn-helix transcriptional regulator [Limosilactobacillus antri]
MSTTGEKIKYLRKQRGISAEKLAKELKVSPATIYRYENGDIEKMPTSTISSIASLLGTTPSYLMGWDSDNNSKLTKERPKVRSLARRMDKLSDDDLDLINDLLDKFDK